MGLGPLQKRPQREELVSLLRVQTPREAGSPPPGRGSPPAPGAASEKHLLFTSHSTLETLWLPQPGEGAGTRGRANGISWAEARHPPGRRTAPHKELFGPQHAARWGPGPVGVGAPATVSPWALRGACHVTGQLSERQPPPRRGRRLSGHGRGPSTGPGGGSAGSCPQVPTPPLRSLVTPMSRFLLRVLLRSKREGVPGEPRQPGI